MYKGPQQTGQTSDILEILGKMIVEQKNTFTAKEITQLIRDYKIDINDVELMRHDEEPCSLLEYTIYNENIDAAKLLLQLGASFGEYELTNLLSTLKLGSYYNLASTKATWENHRQDLDANRFYTNKLRKNGEISEEGITEKVNLAKLMISLSSDEDFAIVLSAQDVSDFKEIQECIAHEQIVRQYRNIRATVETTSHAPILAFSDSAIAASSSESTAIDLPELEVNSPELETAPAVGTRLQ